MRLHQFEGEVTFRNWKFGSSRASMPELSAMFAEAMRRVLENDPPVQFLLDEEQRALQLVLVLPFGDYEEAVGDPTFRCNLEEVFCSWVSNYSHLDRLGASQRGDLVSKRAVFEAMSRRVLEKIDLELSKPEWVGT